MTGDWRLACSELWRRVIRGHSLALFFVERALACGVCACRDSNLLWFEFLLGLNSTG
jgi:hypothetical protein